jgi:hypothetical protein
LGNPQASLEELTQTAATLGVEISPQALDQRFTMAAATCVQQVLDAALTRVITADPVAIPLLARFTAVSVQDIDLQKMNWKCRTGIDESMGVSLKGRRKHNAIGGYSHADQDTGQCCHGQSLAHAVATGVSAR